MPRPNPRIFPFFLKRKYLRYFGPIVLACHIILKLTEHGTRKRVTQFFISLFLSVAWSITAQLMTFFCFGFPEVLFGSPGHDLHLSSITLNLLSPQLSFFMVLKCNLFVYRGNSLMNSRVIMQNKQPL